MHMARRVYKKRGTHITEYSDTGVTYAVQIEDPADRVNAYLNDYKGPDDVEVWCLFRSPSLLI